MVRTMIENSKNKQVKNIINLQKKSKERKKQNLYVIEGKKVIKEIPKEDLVKIFVSESFYNSEENAKYIGAIESLEVVKDSIFDSMSDTKTPQGILAVVKTKTHKLTDILNQEKTLILILEDIQDPGNMGTIIRTGEGAGINGIIVTSSSVDIYNPKVVRSTMGSILRMPIVVTDDIYSAIDELKSNNVAIYASYLGTENSYTNINYKMSTGIMIGNESKGLTDDIVSKADELIKIPLKGQVESLNASIAASLLMYEVVRQRSYE